MLMNYIKWFNEMLVKVIKAKRQAEAKIAVVMADAILVQLLHRETAALEELPNHTQWLCKYRPEPLITTYVYTFKDIKTSNNITEYPVWLHIRFNYEI